MYWLCGDGPSIIYGCKRFKNGSKFRVIFIVSAEKYQRGDIANIVGYVYSKSGSFLA
jgi:hypothetical protein